MAVSKTKKTSTEASSEKNVKNPIVSESIHTSTARAESEDKSENIISQKLLALHSLQVVDTQIDKIRIVRGELPLEVQDLEDVIEGLSTRIDNLKKEIAEYKQNIDEQKHAISQYTEMIKKYESQQENVRNNREYESLSKEIEYQNLEIKLCEKKIKEAKALSETKQVSITEATQQLADKKENLKEKQNELTEIIEETEKEEKTLLEKSEKARLQIDERLLNAYTRIRKNVRNGLAVVKVERDACGGCFSKIPPQRQMEIKLNKKIIVCEYCGRILVDADLVENNQ